MQLSLVHEDILFDRVMEKKLVSCLKPTSLKKTLNTGRKDKDSGRTHASLKFTMICKGARFKISTFKCTQTGMGPG